MLYSKIKSTEFDNGNNSSFASHRCEYLLCLALDIGEGILKSGGEISRVEDTVSRICRAYGAIHVEVFAIPSVIIASIRMADGEYSSQTRRVYGSENNLSKVEAYSDISYNVCKNRPPLEELDEMIRKQKRKKAMPLERHSKGQFSKIRYISKGVCRILRLCLQMQCLSRKLMSHR